MSAVDPRPGSAPDREPGSERPTVSFGPGTDPDDVGPGVRFGPTEVPNEDTVDPPMSLEALWLGRDPEADDADELPVVRTTADGHRKLSPRRGPGPWPGHRPAGRAEARPTPAEPKRKTMSKPSAQVPVAPAQPSGASTPRQAPTVSEPPTRPAPTPAPTPSPNPTPSPEGGATSASPPTAVPSAEPVAAPAPDNAARPDPTSTPAPDGSAGPQSAEPAVRRVPDPIAAPLESKLVSSRIAVPMPTLDGHDGALRPKAAPPLPRAASASAGTWSPTRDEAAPSDPTRRPGPAPAPRRSDVAPSTEPAAAPAPVRADAPPSAPTARPAAPTARPEVAQPPEAPSPRPVAPIRRGLEAERMPVVGDSAGPAPSPVSAPSPAPSPSPVPSPAPTPSPAAGSIPTPSPAERTPATSEAASPRSAPASAPVSAQPAATADIDLRDLARTATAGVVTTGSTPAEAPDRTAVEAPDRTAVEAPDRTAVEAPDHTAVETRRPPVTGLHELARSLTSAGRRDEAPPPFAADTGLEAEASVPSDLLVTQRIPISALDDVDRTGAAPVVDPDVAIGLEGERTESESGDRMPATTSDSSRWVLLGLLVLILLLAAVVTVALISGLI